MNAKAKSTSGFSRAALIVCLILGVIGFSDLGDGVFFYLTRPLSAILFIVFLISYMMENQNE